MCRLLGYVTRRPVAVANSLGKATFDQFTSLCDIHGDGWGMAWHDSSGGLVTRTSHLSGAVDPAYATLAATPLSAHGMVHLRWATDGLDVSPANTHPFTDGTYALAHNGSIAPIPALEDLLDTPSREALAGTTDSERYFRYLTMLLKVTDDETSAVLEGVETLRARFPMSSLNALLLTPTRLFAIHVNSAATGPIADVLAKYGAAEHAPIGHTDSGGYFAMAYRSDGDSVHVISSGTSPQGWRPVPADSVLEIDLQTAQVSQIALTAELSGSTPAAADRR